ncbi:hypothetical protein [Halostagnicola sp. A-GB9-2]|nr:hypothetical protein [Halostagnicola sp. A-GB9-2]MDJ1431173.1 hypothetical protein [Halostagnicola sp. A-GB9-2]
MFASVLLEAPPPDLAPPFGILLLLLVGSAIVWVYADAKKNST